MTSSPHYPQSNGLAERTIRTVKGLLSNSPDPYLSLLSFRATPIPWCSFSPAQLLMGRQVKTCTDIPTLKKELIPQWSYISDFRERDKECKAKEKRDYDNRHRTRPLILYFQTLQCILELVMTKQLVRYALMQTPQGLTW